MNGQIKGLRAALKIVRIRRQHSEAQLGEIRRSEAALKAQISAREKQAQPGRLPKPDPLHNAAQANYVNFLSVQNARDAAELATLGAMRTELVKSLTRHSGQEDILYGLLTKALKSQKTSRDERQDLQRAQNWLMANRYGPDNRAHNRAHTRAESMSEHRQDKTSGGLSDDATKKNRN